MHRLRPPEEIQKMLISTSSDFRGEFESDLLLVALALGNSKDQRHQMSFAKTPLSRTTYVLAFEGEPATKEPGSLVRDYSWVGDLFCIYASILFGKRFDCHGLVEGFGIFHVPNYSLFQSLTKPNLPQNSNAPRADIDIPLNFEEVSKIEPLFKEGLDGKFLNFLNTAGRFYLQALQNFEERPDVAYLNLITSAEVLSNYYEIDKDELLDDDAREILGRISEASKDGPKLAKRIKGRMFQVKRKFLRLFTQLLTDPFFSSSEAEQDFGRMKKDDIAKRMSAAYDLRSLHVHTGIPFGNWISRGIPNFSEVQMGMPMVPDEKFKTALATAPTFFGLERAVRYCLLRFIHTHGIPIDPRLSD